MYVSAPLDQSFRYVEFWERGRLLGRSLRALSMGYTFSLTVPARTVVVYMLKE